MTRKWLFVIFIGLCIFVSGCKTKQNCDLQEDVCVVASNRDEEKENFNHDFSLFQEIYTSVYDNSEENSSTVKNIIEKFGQAGYVAVDSENNVNMTCTDEVLEFIRKHESCERGQIQVIQVSYDDGFSLYDICTSEGDVCVYQTYYKYINGQLTESQNTELKVNFFCFTDEGYLMIEGLWYSPEQYILTLSEEEEHIALRVSPLEDMCRELCDKYIVPVSYRRNNMFITEWNQEDYSNLDFYDLFEKFYYETNKTNFPYVMNDNLSIGNEYCISSEVFENVIMQHMQVTENDLRDMLRYDVETDSYIFRPRGFCEFDYAHVPYPEVVSYRENADGTLTLLVHAVFPTDNTSKLFAHEVTVKDINGEIYYLSNHILEYQELNLWWHADRYTDEEWEEYYGGNETEQETEENIEEDDDISWMFPEVESELFSEEEKVQLESEIMSSVKKVWNLYDNVTISEGTSYNSGIIGFTKEQRMAVVAALGKNNVVATSENINMVNGEKLDEYSCAVTPQIRQTGNQLSGLAGTAYASLLA